MFFSDCQILDGSFSIRFTISYPEIIATRNIIDHHPTTAPDPASPYAPVQASASAPVLVVCTMRLRFSTLLRFCPASLAPTGYAFGEFCAMFRSEEPGQNLSKVLNRNRMVHTTSTGDDAEACTGANGEAGSGADEKSGDCSPPYQ